MQEQTYRERKNTQRHDAIAGVRDLVLASMLSITSARKQEIRMLRDLGASDWTVFCYSLKFLLPGSGHF